MNFNEILESALRLPESDRLRLADRLFESLPEPPPGFPFDEDDPRFLEELRRRASEPGNTIPADELWNDDSR